MSPNRQRGRIVALRNGRAQAEFQAPECVACAEGRGCGGGIFSAWLNQRRPRSLWLQAESHWRVGDWIEIEMAEAEVARLSLVVYGLPLLGILAGIALGSLGGEALAAAGGVSGLLAGGWIGSRIAGHTGYLSTTGCPKRTE
ncbi:MAG: SoxR reducing system RseC family protein [Xanthomonadales bacterium]|nr:SoxR reducing system RseC family protein [Xanthomonadales bacterium]